MKSGCWWVRWKGFEGAHPSQVAPFIVEVDAEYGRVSLFGSDDDYTLDRFEDKAIFLSGPLHPLDCEELEALRELERIQRATGVAEFERPILDRLDSIRARR